jgi:uroporphyrinogen-III synthase
MISEAGQRPRLTVLVTRPRPQAVATARRLHLAGHRVLIDPLLAIQTIPAPIPIEGIAAVLLTSANAVQSFSPRLADLPVYAVGRVTATAARQRGWREVHSADGDAQDLGRLLRTKLAPAAGALLHLSGEETRAGFGAALEAAGFDYRRVVVYRAVPAATLALRSARALRDGALDAVLLYSPRTAAVFRALVEAGQLAGQLQNVTAVCLSDAVADRVDLLPWREVLVAGRRDQDALFTCLEGLTGTC